MSGTGKKGSNKKVFPMEPQTFSCRQRTDHMLQRGAGIGNLSYANEAETPPKDFQASYDPDDAGSPTTIVAK